MESITLTPGAILKMTTADLGEGYEPILQVLEVKKIPTPRNAAVGQDVDRYKLALWDGSRQQHGMLGTQLNSLVNQGKLQKGSVIRLEKYTCTLIQGRQIIIIIALEVLLDTCDIIGDPVVTRTPNAQSSGTVSGNTQSLSGGFHGVVHEPTNQSYGGSFSGNSDLGRYGTTSTASNHPRPVNNTGFTGSASTGGLYVGQSTSFCSPRSQIPTPLQNSYENPPQPMYPPSNSYAQLPQSTFQQPPMSSYGRAPQPTYQHPPLVYIRGPAAKAEPIARIVGIETLNPYQSRWLIKVRVTAKSELRSYSNNKGDGKVFNFDLIDSGGEIRATCFNALAEQFYNLIEVGKIYLISKGTLKEAKRNFNHLNNAFEIQLDSTSTIQQCFEDDGSIPLQQFNFRPISDIEGLETNSIVDIVGVVSSISPAASIKTKNGDTQKRTLRLKDMSSRSVEVTLWGNLCNVEGQKLQSLCDSGEFPVLAVKAGKVNDFNGRTVGTISSTQLFIEPDDAQAKQVRLWFEREGMNSQCVSISKESSVGQSDIWKTLSQIKDEKLGTSEKPDWITVSATVTFIKDDNYFYPACPLKFADRQCNKKVDNNGDGTWRCERCNQSVAQCDYRYILNLQIQDHTGIAWVTAFQESGEQMMGITAKEFQYLKYEMQDEEKVTEILKRVLLTAFIFKLKVQEATYNDEARVKSTIVKADKVKFSSHSRHLLDLMEKLKNESCISASTVGTAKPFTGMNNTGAGSTTIRQHTPSVNYGYSTNSASTSGKFGGPANQVGHFGSQYNTPRVRSTGSAGLYASCNICGGAGHSSMNCPHGMNAPGQSSGGGYTNSRPAGNNSGECYKCQQPGHFARDCPGSNRTTPAYRSSGVQPGRYGISNQSGSY